MLSDLHSDDRLHDDERISQATREEYESALADVEREREALAEFARAALLRLAAKHRRIIDRTDWRTRSSFKLEMVEVAGDVADAVTEAFSGGLDETELRRIRDVLETGRD
jgi:hypothetical protein